ncbi:MULTISPECIES: HPr family phosphocarrier protein [unclassified Butyrivibrio]|jgi:phosphocarrier protein|uniref:HPr family phosphocarrier protein n=1 Tax=unclassified Butyrivibrio TaxID=2639466 RepID=UPI00041A1D53|nr:MULTISPECIES: HPr family phosphocarrier protein [unclassified Butyrivibrio]MCR5343931.1 HPr family phosphocarrier protein [Butyrivibrio sp.]
MVSKNITVKNEQGMHMRPASLLSQKATPFDSNIKILFNGNSYDCKSVMFLMSACIKCGSEIVLECDGPDEEKALAELSEFIESGMGD